LRLLAGQRAVSDSRPEWANPARYPALEQAIWCKGEGPEAAAPGDAERLDGGDVTGYEHAAQADQDRLGAPVTVMAQALTGGALLGRGD
jgi:hypothetical protein